MVVRTVRESKKYTAQKYGNIRNDDQIHTNTHIIIIVKFVRNGHTKKGNESEPQISALHYDKFCVCVRCVHCNF